MSKNINLVCAEYCKLFYGRLFWNKLGREWIHCEAWIRLRVNCFVASRFWCQLSCSWHFSLSRREKDKNIRQDWFFWKLVMSSFQRASTEVEWNKQTRLRDSRFKFAVTGFSYSTLSCNWERLERLGYWN